MTRAWKRLVQATAAVSVGLFTFTACGHKTAYPPEPQWPAVSVEVSQGLSPALLSPWMLPAACIFLRNILTFIWSRPLVTRTFASRH
jgi:hypothetical protein